MIELRTTLELGTVFVEETGDRLPSYKGAYKVTPKTSQIILPTKDKSMTENVTIYQIPYAETTNSAGGQTITIGLE